MVEPVCLDEILLASAQEIFSTMIFMDIQRADENMPQSANSELLGSITFKGGIEGCLAICCTRQCAEAIAANMLALESANELTEENTCDAMGEITNMIMGGLKARILKMVNTLEVSIPSVVRGHELRNTLGDGSEKVSVRVNIDDNYIAELLLMYREKCGQ